MKLFPDFSFGNCGISDTKYEETRKKIENDHVVEPSEGRRKEKKKKNRNKQLASDAEVNPEYLLLKEDGKKKISKKRDSGFSRRVGMCCNKSVEEDPNAPTLDKTHILPSSVDCSKDEGRRDPITRKEGGGGSVRNLNFDEILSLFSYKGDIDNRCYASKLSIRSQTAGKKPNSENLEMVSRPFGINGTVCSSSACKKTREEEKLETETSRNSSRKRKKGEKVFKKGTKDGVRVVSPYFQTKINEGGLTKKAKRLENIVRKTSPYFAPKEADIEVIKPDNSAGRKGAKTRRVSRSKSESAKSCVETSVSVRKTSPYFADLSTREDKSSMVSEKGGTELQVTSEQPKKAKKVSPQLSAAQKRDEAYERSTSDNTWKPPISPFGLLQEKHVFDPWRVLIICILLNRTQGVQ